MIQLVFHCELNPNYYLYQYMIILKEDHSKHKMFQQILIVERLV